MIGYAVAFALGALVGSPVIWFVVCRTLMEGAPWNWTCWPWNR